MTYGEIISRVSSELGLPKVFVDRVYRSYWKAVREYITALPLKQDLTDEEFMSLRPNVNVPSIGKLYVTLDRYHNMKKSEEVLRRLREERNNDEDKED